MIDHVHKLNVVLYVYDACFFQQIQLWVMHKFKVTPYDQYNVGLFMTMAVIYI